ncbi:DMT family transporter [Helicobacter pametensis]|uniref:DMT family transporter n=1 Tax=Helicobacter pametensis TaxID=95149 RepID=UPI000480F5A1|nr:multidrug efflux SMR transporter [Helicobacter pametensis]
MSWIYLITSGIFEIFGILIFKKVAHSQGKSLIKWLVILALNFCFSLGLLSLAMQTIDMSIAYAVWTGIGASGGVIAARIFYQELLSIQKTLCLIVIIASMVGLKLVS